MLRLRRGRGPLVPVAPDRPGCVTVLPSGLVATAPPGPAAAPAPALAAAPLPRSLAGVLPPPPVAVASAPPPPPAYAPPPPQTGVSEPGAPGEWRVSVGFGDGTTSEFAADPVLARRVAALLAA